MGPYRTLALRLGTTLVAMACIAGDAMAQKGPMSPGGPPMAPPPHIAPPPQAPIFAPAPQAPIFAPAPPVPTVTAAPHTPTVSPSPSANLPTPAAGTPLPGKNASSGERQIPAGGGAPVTLGPGFKAVPGVAVTFGMAGGVRQAVSDAKGMVSLGKLPQGTFVIAFPGQLPGAKQPTPELLVGLLLPAVQKVREAHALSASYSPGMKREATLEIGPNGEVKSVAFTGGVRVAVGDINGDGVPDLVTGKIPSSGDIRLVFAIRESPSIAVGAAPGGAPPPPNLPTSAAGGRPLIGNGANGRPGELKIPAGGGAPVTLGAGFKAVPGVAVFFPPRDNGGVVGVRQTVSDANGMVSLGKLPQGTFVITFQGQLAGAKQPAPELLVGLLLPAVQKVREAARRQTASFSPGMKREVKLEIGPDGEVKGVTWSNGVRVAVGDVDGDGVADLLAGEIPSSSDIRLVFAIRESPSIAVGAGPGGEPLWGNGGNGGAGGELQGSRVASIDSFTWRGTLAKVGVTGKGPGGAFQAMTNEGGTAWFGKLPIGNTTFDFNGGDVASALNGAVGPNNPKRQETLIELLVVIAIIAIKQDGEPVMFSGTWPAGALPQALRADLRVGRDGNLMAVNWGDGEQAPQSLTKVGQGALVLGGANTYSGPTTVNQGLEKTFLDSARQGKAGETGVFIFAIRESPTLGSTGGKR